MDGADPSFWSVDGTVTVVTLDGPLRCRSIDYQEVTMSHVTPELVRVFHQDRSAQLRAALAAASRRRTTKPAAVGRRAAVATLARAARWATRRRAATRSQGAAS
jgi:hypothetical protein